MVFKQLALANDRQDRIVWHHILVVVDQLPLVVTVLVLGCRWLLLLLSRGRSRKLKLLLGCFTSTTAVASKWLRESLTIAD